MERRTFLRGTALAAVTVGTAGVGDLVTGGPARAALGPLSTRLAALAGSCVTVGPTNGGFEDPVVDGLIPGWTQTFGSTGVEVVDTRASEGTHSLHLLDEAATSAVGVQSDQFAVTAERFHVASARAYLEQGAVALYVFFYDAGGAQLASHTRLFQNVVAGWQLIELGATSPADATHASVLLYSPVGPVSSFYVDEIQVVATDATVETFGPAALLATISGLAVVGTNAYIAGRGELAEIDLAAKSLRRTFPLSENDGAWAMTVSEGIVFFAVGLAAYSFDPAAGELRALGNLGSGSGTTWCMTTAPDGIVYAGTYPAGQVWEITPGTGALRNLGTAVPGQQYVRAIAADEQFVYAGTQPVGHLIAYDRITGEKRDITPSLDTAFAVTVMTRNGDRIIAGAGSQLIDVLPDGSDAHIVTLPDSIADAMAVETDGTLYVTGRPSGSLYKRVGDELLLVGTPISMDETRAIVPLDDGTLLGASGSGALWWFDIAAGATTIVDLADLGLSEPEPAQSITLGSDGKTVYVGGSTIITAHRPTNGTSLRLRVPGQPKQLQFIDGRLYAATYPRTDVIELNPRIKRARSLGVIGRPQYRPLTMDYDPGTHQLLVGTAPVNGLLAGALSLVDIGQASLEVITGILHDQAVASIAVDNGIAYLAGDAQGVSVPPTQPSATIAAYDIANKRVLWEVAPLAGHLSIAGIAVHNGVLYGVNKRRSGTWFALDLQTRQVIHQGILSGAHSYGEIFVHRDRVFAAVHDGLVFVLGPGLDDARLVLDGLTDGFPQSLPQLAFVPDTWNAWSMDGDDLALLGLEPSCLSG